MSKQEEQPFNMGFGSIKIQYLLKSKPSTKDALYKLQLNHETNKTRPKQELLMTYNRDLFKTNRNNKHIVNY